MAGPLAWWLLFGVGVLLCVGFSSSPRLRTVMIFLGAGLPAVIVFFVVDRQSPAFGDVRIRLEAVSFARTALARPQVPAEASARPVGIGGDARRDDLFLDGLPGTLATLDSGGVLRAYPFRAPTPPRTASRRAAEVAMVSVRRGNSDIFLGAYQIGPGDRLCVENCASADAEWFALASDQGRLVLANGGAAQLPTFRSRTIGYYRPSQAIFPLRDYGRERGRMTGADGCGQRFLCDRATGRPVRSFLFHDGASQMFIALLDRDAVIERGGDAGRGAVRPAEALSVPIGGDQPVSAMTVWEAVYAGPDIDFTVEARPSYLVARRVFNLSLTPDRLRIGFKRQPTVSVAEQDVRLAARQLEEDGIASPVSVNLSGVPADPKREQRGNAVQLGSIGGALAAAIAPDGDNPVRLIFGRDFIDRGASRAILPSIGGSLEPPAAEGGTLRFHVGSREASGGGRVAELSLDRFNYPDLLLPVVAFWGLLFAFLQRAIWSECRPALIVALIVQILLLLRLFVAIGSAGFDSQIDYRAQLSAALVTNCAIPYLLATLFPHHRGRLIDYLPCGLAVAALSLVLYRSNGLELPFLLLGVLAGLFGIWRAWAFPPPPSAPAAAPQDGPIARRRERLLAIARKCVRAFRTWLARWGLWACGLLRKVPLLGWLAGWSWRSMRSVPWFWLGGSLVVVRLALLLFLIRERVEVPGIGRLGLSVIYLPASLLVVAGLAQDVLKVPDGKGVRWAMIRLVVMVGLLFLAIPYFVSDIGFALVYLPPILVAVVVFVWGAACRAERILGGIAVAFVILAFLGSIAVATFGAAPGPVPENVATSEVDQLAQLEAAASTRRDDWRLSAVVNPDAVNEAGTSAAEQIRRWRYLLATFTERAEGWGFPFVADVSDLRPVQADDNVSAIHLIGAFGRTAAAMFLLLLGLGAVLLVRTSEAARGIGSMAGQLASWVIFAAAAYMILANLVMVPFTGRNVYFLAARSNSDLLEGSILLAMILGGLAARRREPAP